MSIIESELNKGHVTCGEAGECGKAVRAESQFSVTNIVIIMVSATNCSPKRVGTFQSKFSLLLSFLFTFAFRNIYYIYIYTLPVKSLDTY